MPYVTLSFISTVVIRFLPVVFEFSATFEVGGERKKKNLHHWLMFKKKLFMTLGEDRLTSWCWHGWVLGCRLPPSPCVLTWQKGLGTSMLLLFSR